VYLAPPPYTGNVPLGISLITAQGAEATRVYDFYRGRTSVAQAGIPRSAFTFRSVRVAGLTAYWQAASLQEGGILAAYAHGTLFRLDVQGSHKAEAIAEKALGSVIRSTETP